MSETGPLADLWTGRYLDYVGLGCILTAVDIGVKDQAYIGAIALFFVGGVVLAAGLTWERVKLRISPVLYTSLRRMGSDARSWVAVLMALIIGARGPAVIRELKGSSATITGTADVPAGAQSATITVPAALPYTIHHLSPDWETAGTFVLSKESGHFEVGFNRPPPIGGGAIEWEIVPRAGSENVALVAQTETPSPTPSPTPIPTVEQFRHGGYPIQAMINYLKGWPRPGEHDVNIVATEESHDIAKAMVETIQGGSVGNQIWVVKEHGQGSGVFIGNPTEYALDDGFTIRAHADSADAEELRAAMNVAGFDPTQVKRAISPQNDGHDYVSLEIGNFLSR